jgi:hypothetical protein
MTTAGGTRTGTVELPHVTRLGRRALPTGNICPAGCDQERYRQNCDVPNAQNVLDAHSCSPLQQLRFRNAPKDAGPMDSYSTPIRHKRGKKFGVGGGLQSKDFLRFVLHFVLDSRYRVRYNPPASASQWAPLNRGCFRVERGTLWRRPGG